MRLVGSRVAFMKNTLLVLFVVVLASGCSQGGGSGTSDIISGCYSLTAGEVTGTCGGTRTSNAASLCLEQEGNTITVWDPSSPPEIEVEGTPQPVASKADAADRLTGTVSGNSFSVNDSGTIAFNGCSIAMGVTIQGTASGNAIEGSMGVSMNSSGDCEEEINCTSDIGFTGSRVADTTAAAKTVASPSPRWFFLRNIAPAKTEH